MSYNKEKKLFSGFQLMSKTERAAAIPPPPGSALSKQGYSTMSSITENALCASWGLPKKRVKTEDEYFEEEDETPKLDYIPAPGSPGAAPIQQEDSDSEEDPLDAFMAGIESEIEKGTTKSEASKKGVRVDIDSEDVEESYYKYMEENPRAGLPQDDDSDVDLQYDEEGNPIAPKKNKYIDPLPPIDHSAVEYKEFVKDFYRIHEEIAALDEEKVADLRRHLGVTVSGPNPPKPVTSFGHFGFDDGLMKVIRKTEFTQPTPIQAQAVPAALSGRDVIGIAKTGSGKTAAFVWPMIVHIVAQKELATSDGPIGLILAPTRELSQQIYTEAKKFGKIHNLTVVCAYGGGSKWEQSKALEQGAEIVVATPGRMIDLIKMKATNLERVTFMVLDEADKMFDLGFEPQVRSICDHVRPDRQTLLFSATFKKKVEKLARDVLIDPVRILYGDYAGEANTDIEQKVVMMLPTNKLPWLLGRLVDFTSAGGVLIFVTRKLNAEELASQLRLKEIDCLLLHGDCDQIERNRVITAFKKKECSILVATDVAARGLDIPHIRTVVNFDVARDIDTHTHRIGRTGRAGTKGTAYTLVTSTDKDFAGHLVRNLEGANQPVPQELIDLASTSNWFKKSRFKTGSTPNVGGAGFGYVEPSRRPDIAPKSAPKPAKSGPAMDRLSAIKSAFKAQYEAQFTASHENAEILQQVQQKRRKKSRWDASDD